MAIDQRRTRNPARRPSEIERAARIAEQMLTEDLRRGVWTPCTMTALGALRFALNKPPWTADERKSAG